MTDWLLSAYGSYEGLRWRTAQSSIAASDLVLSMFICSYILASFLFTTPQTQHWFVIPVWIRGSVIGIDAVRVLRGKIEIFDPVGFVGIIGYHLFFLAPLLHVRFDSWMAYVLPPDDWREWLGRMAWLNVVSLLAYIAVRSSVQLRSSKLGKKSEWRLDGWSYRQYTILALAYTAILQLVIYRQSGGIIGYIRSYEEGGDAFRNFGVILSIAESFPIIAMMGFVVWEKKRRQRMGWWSLFAVLVVYFLVTMLFGGLRGSRGNTIWVLFWAIGLIHLWIRPVPKKLMLLGAIFVVIFMYMYGFYKELGTDALTLASNQGGIAAVEEQTGRRLDDVVLGDLARSDVQAYLLYKLDPYSEEIDYEFAQGRSYLGGVALVIPRWIWPERPPSKATYGTDALYGSGAHETRSQLSSRAYGLAGEGMLNFGPLSVPVLYALYGGLIGYAQKWRENLSPNDCRLLLVPFVTVMTFYFLVWDPDNIVFFLFKRGGLPVTLILLSSTIVHRRRDSDQMIRG